MFLERKYTYKLFHRCIKDLCKLSPRWQSWISYCDCNLKHHLIVRQMVFLIIHCTLISKQLMEERCSFLTIVSLLLLFLFICQLSNQSCVLLNNSAPWKMSHVSPEVIKAELDSVNIRVFIWIQVSFCY